MKKLMQGALQVLYPHARPSSRLLCTYATVHKMWTHSDDGLCSGHRAVECRPCLCTYRRVCIVATTLRPLLCQRCTMVRCCLHSLVVPGLFRFFRATPWCEQVGQAVFNGQNGGIRTFFHKLPRYVDVPNVRYLGSAHAKPRTAGKGSDHAVGTPDCGAMLVGFTRAQCLDKWSIKGLHRPSRN